MMKRFQFLRARESESDLRRSLRLLTVLCMAGIFLLFLWMKPESFQNGFLWEKGQTPDIYSMQADALLDGHAYLNEEVSDGLAALDNPYDPAQRRGVSYRWDFAYFNGRYYCYSGIAPTVLFHLPVRLLTGCYPTLSAACLFFSELAVLFLALALWEFRRVLCPDAPAWLLLFALPCLICSTGITYTAVFQDRYYFPLIAAIAFSFGFWAAILRGLSSRGFGRSLGFALGAILLSLAVLSRPTVALMNLSALPFFLRFLRVSAGRERIRGIVAFFLPLSAGAAVTILWNAWRFGSPLDFGANYQLTVSDISKNHLTPSWFSYSFRTFFLLKPKFVSRFLPLFHKDFELPPSRAIYRDKIVGSLWFPAVWGILSAFGFRRRDGHAAFRGWVLLTVLLAVWTAWFDYCIGGVNLRYTLDFLPFLLLCGTVASMRFIGERERPLVRAVCADLLVVALFLSAALSLGVRAFL